ncbi:uncharacterized protein C8R40DRAFT_1239842 [Lentinula edodes]|uniref:uncharacterized protein n=1 Tax=Lentinula edodes TaxID=5353 RepID=UPI001BF4BB72|nr:uncharacterized protein C8R40DRAFT_1239842 [Lentinula edodes]KAF8830163.1 hypothetical protein HHX47_DHR2000660 [Lentinula edodes]KAH7871498.1 hypothetical protein C8R40DRAFT_1239842 [Lentinula edodes]
MGSHGHGATPTPTPRELVLVCIFLALLFFMSQHSAGSDNSFLADYSPPLPPLKLESPPLNPFPSPYKTESFIQNDGLVRETTIIKHVPGWTIIDSLYMHNGTYYVVTSNPPIDPPQTKYDPAQSPFLKLPPPKAILSKGHDIYGARGGMGNDPLRAPDEQYLQYVSTAEFQNLFGIDLSVNEVDEGHVHTVPGLTFILNDSPQFITHYYHFCAELWFGVWRTYASLGGGHKLPPPTRVLFPNLDSAHWRDYANMNQLFMRSLLPSTQMLFSHDWYDWVSLSVIHKPTSESKTNGGTMKGKPILFPRVLIADRSAAMPAFNYQRFQRTAAVPFGLLIPQGEEGGDWWSPVRDSVRVFAGLDDDSANGSPTNHESRLQLESQRTDVQSALIHQLPNPPHDRLTVQDLIKPTVEERFSKWTAPLPSPPFVGSEDYETLKENFLVPLKHHANPEGKTDALSLLATSLTRQRTTRPVVTYLSRQDWNRRKLKTEDHERLVAELRKLEVELGIEVIVVSAENLSRWEQIRLVGRSTILIGVHGNGLTAELWMNLGFRSTVIEIFYPGGWAHDYEYTARAMGAGGGLKHYGIWNDQVLTSPGFPPPSYPPGFQGNEIPVDGKTVANLVRDRITAAGQLDDG